MTQLGRNSVLIAAGVVLMLTVAIVPGALGATPTASGLGVASSTTSGPCASAPSGHGAPDPSSQWAYGGQGWSNWSFTFGNLTVTHNASFGWTVIFTEISNKTTGVTTLEEQRTLGVTVWTNLTKPNVTAAYFDHVVELDGAFANVTNQSTVYVNDQPVPALGILNASVAACGAIEQTLKVTNQTTTRMASLNVSEMAEASVAFTPSLGLVPLNLTGVREWNSSSTASFDASWNISYAFTTLNGGSGNASKAGTLGGTAQVDLFGSRCRVGHAFSDHQSRSGVNLALQGPFNAYDGFILVPRSFDLFGTAPQVYDSYGFGSAGISSESLYLSARPGGFAVTAADQSFTGPQTTAVPQASGPSATTVYGQPMTVSQAKVVNQGLTSQPVAPTTPSPSHGVTTVATGNNMLTVGVLVAVAAIAAVAGAGAWIVHSRRC